MIGLDTPILLAVLHGEKGTQELLRSLEGEELATTELNLLELLAIASLSAPRVRAARQAAVDRLRQKLTVVPIDAAAGTRKFFQQKGPRSASDLIELAVLGAMDSHGCSRWITKGARPTGRWKFRVTILA